METEKDEAIGVMQDSHPVGVGPGMDVVEELIRLYSRSLQKGRRKALEQAKKKVRNEND